MGPSSSAASSSPSAMNKEDVVAVAVVVFVGIVNDHADEVNRAHAAANVADEIFILKWFLFFSYF